MIHLPSASRRRLITRRKQTGATLIEVMVSLMVFSLGVLGMVAMQGKAITYAVDSENRSRAALLANEIVAAMWAEGTAAPSTQTDWLARVKDPAASGLPDASGVISPSTDDVTGITTTKVTITWRAPSKISSEGDSTYFTQVVIP